MKKIGLFFAPEGGNVEKVTKKVIEKIGSEKIDLFSVQKIDTDLLKNYDKIIMGISTVGRDSWDSNYSKIGWDFFIPKLDKVDLKNKVIAIFGLGNHILYPENFVDSMGILGKKLIERGAKIIGQTPVEDYDYNDSAAIIDGQFIGVPIDEDNDNDLTDERLDKWLNKIKNDFGL
jgi:flavodoxin I